VNKSRGRGARHFSTVDDLPQIPPLAVMLDQRTTVVFKNLPDGSTRDSFRRILDIVGFKGLYDFLYIPANFKSWLFFGYAVVNFLRHEDAARCVRAFECDSVRQDMVVQWSEEHQGLDVHIDRYRNSPIMHRDVCDGYKPILLSKGKRIRFPPPTRFMRPPRTLPGNRT